MIARERTALATRPVARRAARLGPLARRRERWFYLLIAPWLLGFLLFKGGAPLVAELLEGASVPDLPPAAQESAAWLARQLAQNRARLRAFEAELAAVLEGAAAHGVPVMPLKGALLAFTLHREPGLRPMADLDLLVQPDDELALHELLAGLGYRLMNGRKYSGVRHRTYERPTDRVASGDGTHVDNPRRVELHTRLIRTVWLDHGGAEMGAWVWSSSREGELLGRPAQLPSPEALVIDVAAHATGHSMRGAGTLLQWYDIAALAARAERLDTAFAGWSYPALALATRAFYDPAIATKVMALAEAVDRNMVHHVAGVPLDDRAGLNLLGVHSNDLSWFASRWRRWRPNPWIVRLAYPGAPLPLAYPAYVGGVGVRAARKAVLAVLGGRR